MGADVRPGALSWARSPPAEPITGSGRGIRTRDERRVADLAARGAPKAKLVVGARDACPQEPARPSRGDRHPRRNRHLSPGAIPGARVPAQLLGAGDDASDRTSAEQ